MAIRSARGPERARDDAEFFAACSQLRRSIDGLDGALEWPTLRAMLPDLTGRSVLDLGCGFGWFCRRAAITGAARVVGIDLSERMLTRARAEHDDRIEYQRQDLDQVELPARVFDVAYSSLTLHYLTNLDHRVGQVHRALVPGGLFVFSVEHPILTAPPDRASSQPPMVDWCGPSTAT